MCVPPAPKHASHSCVAFIHRSVGACSMSLGLKDGDVFWAKELREGMP